MRSTFHSTITTRQIQDAAAGPVADFLKLRDYGRSCLMSTLLHVLLFAAARRRSISDACARLRDAPSDQTVFNALSAQLSDMATLENRLNAALVAKLPRPFLKRRQRVAFDITKIPYHGQPYKDSRELCHSKAHKGSTRFHAYATACIVRRGERFTVAMTYVWQDDSSKAVVQRLLRRVRKSGIVVEFLLIDREFYNLEVVRYLKRAQAPFLVPVVRRGRRPRSPEKAKGPWRFWTWKRSGWATHTLDNKQGKETVQICVAIDYRSKKGGHLKIQRRFVYAYWGIRQRTAGWMRETYRTRFGIESSYRQMNESRIRTSSRKPVYRLLFVGLALLLRNAWVWLHRTYLARLRGWYLELHLDQLRFGTMLLQLQHLAETILQLAEPVELENQLVPQAP